ncbi:MAG: Hydrolase, NUDIX family [Parcubacteria group bacterium Gr01-1014_106]|nr:MAG: Hydrolase, NUDIX family [Parcubacteria group bacterium Gr01-1014_106]
MNTPRRARGFPSRTPRGTGAHPQAKSSPASRRLPAIYETSAGGVVIRRLRGRLCVALLKTRHTRGDVWVLPKGHVEHARGETHEVAAQREVQEELGIRNVRLVRKLGSVRWQFMGTKNRRQGPRLRGKQEPPSARIIKTVHHYLFEGLTDRLHPQADEGFLEARWVPYEKALRMIAYPTDRAMLEKVRQRPPVRKTP